MTIRRRFYAFVESLKQPRRKFGVVCFLFAFLLADFLFAGIYFLSGYFALKSIGPAAEMAAEMSELYKISVYVDTSEFLWWSIPFFALSIVTAVFFVRYILNNRYLHKRAKRPVKKTERIRAKEDAVVAVRVKAVDPTSAKTQDLRNKPPAWLLDPLAVVTPKTANAAPKAEPAETGTETPYTEQEQVRRTIPVQPFSYSDFVHPAHSVSAPHNTVQRPSRKNAEIPYAGSLQYVERTDKKKKKESPYSPDQY